MTQSKPKPLTPNDIQNIKGSLGLYYPICGTHLPVIYSPFAYENISVKRTWRERLFTRPWRPRQKHRLETKPAIFVARQTTTIFPSSCQCIIIAHPALKDYIIEAFEAKEPAK